MISLHLVAVLAFAVVFVFGFPGYAHAYTNKEKVTFQRTIIDRQNQLNPNFRKIPRKTTQYIIVHTSEGGLKSTLRVVSKGKKRVKGRFRTRGGHAHYVIARDGRTYRIMNKRYVADHAGLSMWNGQTDISKISVGIELAGYHYTPITKNQYRSIGLLIEILQRAYNLDDRAVLTHSQVAYGTSNYWFKKPHRGRKQCAKNFARNKAGLASSWQFDPDVRAGRLQADPNLASIFYAQRPPSPERLDTNVITSTNTAWNIAGDEYDSSTTMYQLPNGECIPGDEIEKSVGWDRIPGNTIVFLNRESEDETGCDQNQVKIITNGSTAWDFAGVHYNKSSTFYFFPGGRLKNGRDISDWDGLPTGTKMIIGYRGPYKITSYRHLSKIAGERYNQKNMLYYFPNKKIISGDAIKDFRRLPRGVLVFVPASREDSEK
ncbi:MAG: peptidoglycan recognition family protein [Bacteroidota bacterium]|jgi:hypothetical protein|nr:peptidoglycan recognition family protein [Bacteroidota bacterium]